MLVCKLRFYSRQNQRLVATKISIRERLNQPLPLSQQQQQQEEVELTTQPPPPPSSIPPKIVLPASPSCLRKSTARAISWVTSWTTEDVGEWLSSKGYDEVRERRSVF